MKTIAKKIVALLSCAAICASSVMSVCVVGASTDIPVITPGSDNSIVVTGTISGATRGNSMLVARLLDEGGKEVYIDYTYTEKKDGAITYAFPELFLPSRLTSGVYTLVISGEDLAEPIEKVWEYNGHDRKLKVLDLIQQTAGTETTIASVLSGTIDGDIPHTDVLAILDFDVYKGFGTAGKAAFEDIITDDVLESIFAALPQKEEDGEYVVDLDAYGTDSEKEKIDTALGIFKSAYYDAIASGLFAEISSVADFKAWYDAYYKNYGFDTEEEEAPNKGVTAIVNAVKEKSEFTQIVKEKSSSLEIQEIKEVIYDSAMLAYIKTKTAGEVRSLLLDFDDAGEFFDGLDAAGLKGLGDLIDTVLAEFKAGDYDDCADALDAINELIENPPSVEEDDKGSSGGGGNRKGSVTMPITPTTPADEEETATAFTDLGGVEWAKEAIEFLAECGIVNGKADGIFAPNDNVTRAEFIKMVVTALGVSGDTESMTFTDVPEDAWYLKYVAAAQNNGIVLGDESGAFYPEANITRQDMAVILYRAAKVERSRAKLTFTDADKISDYATDAVTYLSANGIINGFEDGSFGPLQNATRAQTAVIIYRLVNN